MKGAYERDPTPFLKQKIKTTDNATKRKIEILRGAHEKFERMMSISELRIVNSNSRSGPIIGTLDIVEKIRKRTMCEAEYAELIEGPDQIKKD